MTTDYSSIQEQIQSAMHVLNDVKNNLTPSDMDNGLQALRDLSEYLEQVNESGTPDEQRAALARCQLRVHDIADWLEGQKEEVAGAYRQSIGADKQEFEAMPPAMQEQLHPDTYRIRQSFGLVQAASDTMVTISGSLHSWSGNIEHQELLASQPASSTGGDYEPAAADSDPAPPTLF